MSRVSRFESSGRRAALARLLLLAVGTIAALIVGELLTRLLPIPDLRLVPSFRSPPWHAWMDPRWGNPPGGAYRAHPIAGYVHRSSIDIEIAAAEHTGGAFRFRTNGRGLRRDVETAETKAPGARRVLVLGDSHTDGYVDNNESLSAILESQLAARAPGTPIEVLNAGVVGYSPVQELLWYRTEGAALGADTVIAVFYAGNDVSELDDPSKPRVDDASGVALPPPEPVDDDAGPGRFARPSGLARSRLVGLVLFAVRAGPLAPTWQRLGLPGRTTTAAGYPMDTLIEVLRSCHGCFWQSLQQAAYARREPAAARAALVRAEQLMLRLEREVRATGARFLVALLPTRAQVEPERARVEQLRTARLLGLSPPDLTFEDTVAAALHDRLDAAGVTVIALLDDLREAAKAEPQFYSRDWHLNAAGHRTVAAALRRALDRQGSPPPGRP